MFLQSHRHLFPRCGAPLNERVCCWRARWRARVRPAEVIPKGRAVWTRHGIHGDLAGPAPHPYRVWRNRGSTDPCRCTYVSATRSSAAKPTRKTVKRDRHWIMSCPAGTQRGNLGSDSEAAGRRLDWPGAGRSSNSNKIRKCGVCMYVAPAAPWEVPASTRNGGVDRLELIQR